MATFQPLRTFILTLESYEGGCKRKTVKAWTPEDAIGMFMFGKWIAVDVKEVTA